MHEHSNHTQKSYSGYSLRPRQIKALESLRTSLSHGKKRPVMQAACSFGKTILSAEIINRALAKGKRVIFTVPSIGLVDQTYSKFFNAGIYHMGVMQARHPLTDPTAPVQIATIQTLMRREIPQADLVINDECHIKYQFMEEWMASAKNPFIGLSATPWTQGLGKLYDDLIVGATMQQMMDEKLSCPMRIRNPEGPKPDLSKVKLVKDKETGEEDYHEGQLSKVMNDPKLIGHVVRNWLEHGENRPTLLFCVNKENARNLQAQFEKDGVKTAYMDDKTKPNERTLIGQKLEAGEIQVVAQIATCIYGIDWPFLSCIVWSRPTKSEMRLVQGLGRGIRLDPKNPLKDLIVFDHSLTTTEYGLGHPLDIHHEFLCDGKPKPPSSSQKLPEKKLPTLTCPCGYVKRRGQVKCPECGLVIVPPTEVEYAPGELYEVKRESLPDKKASMDTKQRWYSQLLWMQDQRGYKDGWAARQYKEHFFVWPNELSKTRIPAGQAVLNYVKARLIRWAKSKHNPQASVSRSRQVATLQPQKEFHSTNEMAEFFGASLGEPSGQPTQEMADHYGIPL